MHKKIAKILPFILLLANPLSVFADTIPKTADVPLIGTTQATIVSFTVPQSVDFILNPNATNEEDKFISSNFKISNDCNAPLNVSVKQFDNSPVSPHKFNNVSPDKYTKEEWNNLNYEKSMSEIALGIIPVDTNEWRDSKAKTIYANENKTAQAPIELGALNPNTHANLKLTSNHGNSFSALQSKYLVTFIFDLYSKEPFIPETPDVSVDLPGFSKVYEFKASESKILSNGDCLGKNDVNLGTFKGSVNNTLEQKEGKVSKNFLSSNSFELKNVDINQKSAIDYWIYPTSIVDHRVIATAPTLYHMVSEKGKSLATLWPDNTQSFSKKQLPTDKWSHVIVNIRDKKIYLNGEDVTVTQYIDSWSYDGFSPRFGASYYSSFEGYLSDIKILQSK